MTAAWDPRSTLDFIVSRALELGVFERVNQHEPVNAPGNGLTAAVWGDRIEPIRKSGLASVSCRIAFFIRIYTPMASEPQDAIDPEVLTATATLMAAFAGGFTVGGQARHVDLLGASGAPMSAQAGYLDMDDRQYRVMTLNLPVIFNDVFGEVA